MAKEPWLDDDEQKAWRSYLLMRKTLETHMARHLQREFGLSGSDFEILVNLSEAETGRMRAFELGEATQWEKSRMSHHLTRMEKRGLIRKEACDARYPEIAITDEGLAAIQACAPAHAAPDPRVLRRRARYGAADRARRGRRRGGRPRSRSTSLTDCPPEVRGDADLVSEKSSQLDLSRT